MGKRFLFVIPPFYAHLNPAVAIASQLQNVGHEVAWVTSSKMRGILPQYATIYDSITEQYEWCFGKVQQVAARPRTDQLRAYYREIVLPMARYSLDDAMRACFDFKPDALLVDQYCPAGAITAERLSVPWATSVPSGQLLSPYSRARQPWIDDEIAQFAESSGVRRLNEMSEALILSYISPLLAPTDAFPPQTKFVGPAIDASRLVVSDVLSEWPGRRLLVSLGTIYGDQCDSFLLKLADVLDRAGVQGVFTSTSPRLRNMPVSALVRPGLPNLTLLSHVDAIVTHGGAGTTLEGLYYGKPLIVAPLAYDHFSLAEAVVRIGAGVRVRPMKATAGDLAHAVDEVLNNDTYRMAAERVGTSLRDGGGAAAAADALLQLAA